MQEARLRAEFIAANPLPNPLPKGEGAIVLSPAPARSVPAGIGGKAAQSGETSGGELERGLAPLPQMENHCVITTGSPK